MQKEIKNKVIERFWNKVKIGKSDECWEWTASRIPYGYGRFVKRIAFKKYIYTYAHRISWEIHNGKIPKGMLICHTCDNPPCVNINHLWLGTAKDNAQDRDRKGRSGTKGMFGELHPYAKLTQETANVIKNLYKNRPDLSYEKIGKEFNVGYTTIRDIVKEKRWNHVK